MHQSAWMLNRTCFFILFSLIGFVAQAQSLSGASAFSLSTVNSSIAVRTELTDPSAKTLNNSQALKDYRDLLKKNDAWIKKLKEEVESKKQSTDQKYENKVLWSKRGGITDGGGNRVQDELYDFWLKKSTLETNANSLLDWNQDLVTAIGYLQEILPDAKLLSHWGLVNQMLMAASKQKWIFDAKPILNVNCWNLSPTVTDMQEVAACNSAFEVRIYAPGFFEMKDRDQAGLIMHELLLSWARDKFGATMSKYDIEFAIREVNNAIFDQKEVQETIKKFFRKPRVLNPDEIEVLIKMRARILAAGSAVCKNEPVTNADYIKAAGASPLVRTYLGEELAPLMQVMILDETEEGDLQKAIFCFERKYRVVPDHGLLSSSCKKQIETVIRENIQDFYQNNQSESGQKMKTMAYGAAEKCLQLSSTSGGPVKIETYLEALDYFEKLYQRLRIESQAPFRVFPPPKG